MIRVKKDAELRRLVRAFRAAVRSMTASARPARLRAAVERAEAAIAQCKAALVVAAASKPLPIHPPDRRVRRPTRAAIEAVRAVHRAIAADPLPPGHYSPDSQDTIKCAFACIVRAFRPPLQWDTGGLAFFTLCSFTGPDIREYNVFPAAAYDNRLNWVVNQNGDPIDGDCWLWPDLRRICTGLHKYLYYWARRWQSQSPPPPPHLIQKTRRELHELGREWARLLAVMAVTAS